MLYGIVLLIHVIVCLILIAVILLQAGRGGGLSDTFGGSAAQSILGTRGAAYLTRATTAFATIFMLTSLGLAILSVHRSKSLLEGIRPTAVVPVAPPGTDATAPVEAEAEGAQAEDQVPAESLPAQSPEATPLQEVPLEGTVDEE